MAAEDKLRVFVINLDRSPDRLTRFMADNTMPDLDFVRIRAVDGKELDRADLVARNLITNDLLYSNNAVACSLSHIECWRRVVADGRTTVVCEDDAILRGDFAQVHKHFASAIAQSDLVYWSVNFGLHMIYEVPGLGEFTAITDEHYLNSEERIGQFRGTSAPTTLFRAKRVWGTACYTITPAGAQRLLDLILPLKNGKVDTVYRTGLWMQPRKCTFPALSIDGDMGLVHIGKLTARVAMPPVAVHRSLDNVSTIDSGREEDRYQAPWADAEGRIHIPLPLSSTNVIALNDTGLELHALKRYAKAIEYFDRALSLNAKVAEPHYNRANALSALGRLDEAVASFDKALAINPGYASAFNNRGFALAQLERFEEAIASYDKVLAIKPDHPRARANRDALLKAKGNG